MPIAAPATTASGSASGSTIIGDLPPSSSVKRAMRSTAAWPIARPVGVEPVKLILSTPGCAASAAPAVAAAAHDVERTGGQAGLGGQRRQAQARSAASRARA